MTATHFNGPVVCEDGFHNGTSSVVTISAATTITRAAHSGKTLILNAAAGKAITLPAVATSAGMRLLFILGAVYATDDWTIASPAADIEGCFMLVSTVVDCDGITTVTLDASAAAENVGDWLSFESDGTYWYIDGRGLGTASITVA